MQIRLASEADIDEMHRVRLSVRENRLHHPTKVRPANYRQMLTENGRGWVAEVGNRIVGFAIGDLRRANIWALFVDPAFEGRGVGRLLHDEMVNWLFEAGADLIWLSTDPATRAERFYEVAGWRPSRVENGEARFELLRQDWLARSDARTAPNKGLQGTPG